MKTLDEVIKAWEICDETVTANCPDCPYDIDCENVPGEDLKADTLHYLKKYRDHYEARNNQVERYQKAAKECEEILTDYVALKQYWAEQQENNPLTWDELKTLKGKPVWIELLGKGHWKGWDVIGDFYTDDFGDAMCTVRLDDYYLTDHGKTWQAYRKERE